MIVEMRTYTLALGATGKYFAAYAEKGLAAQKRVLGHMLGYYSTETGELNQVVHLWAYDSLDDRARRRAALYADPEWMEYVAVIVGGGWVLKQETRFLTPAPFFTLPPPA